MAHFYKVYSIQIYTEVDSGTFQPLGPAISPILWPVNATYIGTVNSTYICTVMLPIYAL